MFRIFLTIVLLFCLTPSFAAINGGIEKREILNYSQVVDANDGHGIAGAKVRVPQRKFVTITDDEGRFNFDTDIKTPVILSVEKEGYKPFSMTISHNSSEPFIIGIEKNSALSVSIDSDLIHIGDNSYSEKSANAGEFRSKSVGAFYYKDFNVPNFSDNQKVYLIIGSVIGIDTLDARKAGQTHVVTSYASAPEIYCNGNKICELKLNGDNNEIEIPKQILHKNVPNNITFKAGRNLFRNDYIDYDDIELANISVEVR